MNKTPIKVGSRIRFTQDVPYYSINKGDYANVVEGFNKHPHDVSIKDDYGCRFTINSCLIVHENDYVEPDKAMNTLEAMQALVAGKKVRKNDWSEFHYIHMVDNVIVNEHKHPHSFYVSSHFNNEQWEEYKEPDWNWKVGDKLSYPNFNGYTSRVYIILYVDNDVLFCKNETPSPGNADLYYFFSKESSPGDLIRVL